jgi:ammonia channel protein AmtB
VVAEIERNNMNTLHIVIVLVAVLWLGFNIGYVKASKDFDKIIDIYKETIEEYRAVLLKDRV